MRTCAHMLAAVAANVHVWLTVAACQTCTTAWGPLWKVTAHASSSLCCLGWQHSCKGIQPAVSMEYTADWDCAAAGHAACMLLLRHTVMFAPQAVRLTRCIAFCCTFLAGKDHSKVLDEHVSTFVDKAKQVSAQVRNWVQQLCPAAWRGSLWITDSRSNRC